MYNVITVDIKQSHDSRFLKKETRLRRSYSK